MVDEFDEDYGPESGPFCIHWADPSDCDEMCRCGHPCRRHYSLGGDCNDCTCEKFVDKEE